MSLGPLMVDIAGLELTGEDTQLLQNPLVGGVILFSRNYESREQLSALTASIHELRAPKLLIAVDQEGGRVQRFRDGFTELPPAAIFGSLFETNSEKGLRLAERTAWLLGVELRSVDIDFSFTPVLDVFNPQSSVINDRAFHRDPNIVVDIARAFISGLHRGGVAAIGKHFPGHGTVIADSHLELPVDERSYYDISQSDLVPFRRLAEKLEGVMPAHVLYPKVDNVAAGYSKVWVQNILRQECGFQGVVFSDDLSMQGALGAGDIVARADAAKRAGCDMLLVCNDRPSVMQLINAWKPGADPVSQVRLIRLHGKSPAINRPDYPNDREWQATHDELDKLNVNPSLALGDDAPA